MLPLLRTIILEGNQLQELPLDLFRLPRLHTLNASHNRLNALPDADLLGATELHYLDVRWGQLFVHVWQQIACWLVDEMVSRTQCCDCAVWINYVHALWWRALLSSSNSSR
mgnify:CR=1 FL=1